MDGRGRLANISQRPDDRCVRLKANGDADDGTTGAVGQFRRREPPIAREYEKTLVEAGDASADEARKAGGTALVYKYFHAECLLGVPALEFIRIRGKRNFERLERRV